MPAPNTQDLSSIIDVVVQVSPIAAIRPTFNELLIVGNSAHISTNDRLKKYTKTADMLTDGFIVTDPEYKAAVIYFSQSPAPLAVYIGRQDAGGGESCLDAIQACRAANFEWYACMSTQAVKADNEAIAAWVETATPSTVYGYTTQEAETLAATAGNIFEYCKQHSYRRTIGMYSADNALAIAGILGYAMGQNSGLANSAYTLKFKNIVGISPDPITTTQIGNVEGNNGNLYLSYGNFYNVFEQGKMANGQFFDEIINLDMLANGIQLNIMDLLYGNPKVPQTAAGVNQLLHAVNQACENAVNIGFLGPGTWTGPVVMNLNTGDPMPNGYVTQAASLSAQSDADRQARKSPPIYVAIKEAGAIHSVLIGVYVSR